MIFHDENDPFGFMNDAYRNNLMKRGIIYDSKPKNGVITEDSEDIAAPDENEPTPETSGEEDSSFDPSLMNQDFPDADYDLQTEIIKFFVNNPGAEPELFREYATSLGVDPDEFQKQANILLTQLIQIYVNDSEDMGYGDALTTDQEIDPNILNMVTPDQTGE